MARAFEPYRTSFSRYLSSLTRNGFYTRHLDADDYWFIERIRHRGYVGGGALGDLMPDTRNFGAYLDEGKAREAYSLWEDHSADPTYYDLEDEAALDERALGQQERALRLYTQEHHKIVRDEVEQAMVAKRLLRAEKRAIRAARQAEFQRQWLQRQANKALEQEVLAQEYRAWEHAQERIAQERAERLRKTAIADLEWESEEKRRTLGVSARQRHEMDEAKRALELAASAIRKLNRKVNDNERRQKYRGHSREDAGGMEASR